MNQKSGSERCRAASIASSRGGFGFGEAAFGDGCFREHGRDRDPIELVQRAVAGDVLGDRRARPPRAAEQGLELGVPARRAQLVPRPGRRGQQLPRARRLAGGLQEITLREVEEIVDVGAAAECVVIDLGERGFGLDEVLPVSRALDVAGVDQRERHVERACDVDLVLRLGKHRGPLHD